MPSGVRVLGKNMFQGCQQLCDVVFEPGSRLEQIGRYCFAMSALREITIPKRVRSIEGFAFFQCSQLSSLRFEEGSALQQVGHYAFSGTQLSPENVKYPKSLRKKGHGNEW